MSGTLNSSTTVGMEGRQATAPMKESCEHQADCLKRIQAILDGGATDEEKEHFKQHIEICKPCIDMYHLEKCIKEALQGKVEKKCCPEKIAAAIRTEITK
ncbi:anti-sigma factor (TIGR02949 family) [Larkinella arboricola]|uniref:Anti-sigma factor (TIGR02949 family) n=2 Tax=Larkinella arboricola TaxID=643671 RepID=A0A327X0N1_LARAB|nr:anti-sigma factor (TIGR02949 family) [Larkinella arboricola]